MSEPGVLPELELLEGLEGLEVLNVRQGCSPAVSFTGLIGLTFLLALCSCGPHVLA